MSIPFFDVGSSENGEKWSDTLDVIGVFRVKREEKGSHNTEKIRMKYR